MAARQAFDRQPAPAPRAIELNGLFGVNRASGAETALPANPGRKQVSVGFDQTMKKSCHGHPERIYNRSAMDKHLNDDKKIARGIERLNGND